MSLSPETIKQQTRSLWKTCFNDSDDFLDIYFNDKYTDERNISVQRDGRIVSALQLIPYRMTFYGVVGCAGYISGLATLPDFRKNGFAANILREAHRRLLRQGAFLSILIPEEEDKRSFYENPRCGSYHTAVYRRALPLDVSQDGETEKFAVERPDEWGRELYLFYRRYTAPLPFMLHPSEEDFYAALEAADLQDGYVLTVRKGKRLTGFCIAVKEADGEVYIRTIAITEQAARRALVEYLCKECGVERIMRRFCLPGSLKDVKSYAMARVIDVPRFLAAVAASNTGYQIHIGVEGDEHIPENNGYYKVEDGKVFLTEEKPDSIVTPGGLAAMFMASQPVIMDLLLDE